ncbi:unnamed protein product [Penicillium salamii]|uniref:Rhodopsin domain-containing protein n=1 Tax=Penicillium salamii TaxID=1612424 RepID=A0A9W4N4S3_9EURO|nr:unnamed protein product [Penicillium salamii]CAG8254624.1 unnamed protein product [Penicillium salamii]CAG8263573.1 unnamed protein product [Penicillium salamii]CAG8376388.1 unnamed protein product [Penicillium salamii]CAG8400587.1 unnamed protein product [Penicillium salamii]
MNLPPPAVLATWPIPNYIDPPTRGHGVLIVNIVCFSLALMIVFLRVYTRVWITRSAGFDDVLILIGLMFGIGMAVATSLSTEYGGMNRHVWDITISKLVTIQQLNLAWEMLFALASCFTKISLLWFCRRLISKGTHPTYNLLFIMAMVFVGFNNLLFVFLSIFQCSPIHAYWDINHTGPYHCLSDVGIIFSGSVINILTDLMATTLPMPLIWSLDLPTLHRLAVISIFAVGVIVNVAGTVRTVYVWECMVVTYDATWMGWPILIASTVEISLGLICSSAPALRPLAAAFLPRLRNSTRNISSSYHRKRSHKLWSSTDRSKESRTISNEGQAGYDSDHVEIMRTVEMENWNDSDCTNTKKMGHVHETPVDNHGRVISPVESIDMKNDVTYASPTSPASSLSRPRNKQDDCEIGRAR